MTIKLPAEIFGKPYQYITKEDIENIKENPPMCPFTNNQCSKVSRELEKSKFLGINIPFGVCTVLYNRRPIIICPQRFYYNNYHLLKTVGEDFLGSSPELIPEVTIKGFGNVDWIAYVKREDGDIDFVGIEIQADSTTSTGKLVKAFSDFLKMGRFAQRSYNFGMNTYNTVKLSYTQLLNKGQIFQEWKVPYIWIIQDVLFDYILDKFNLSIGYGEDSDIYGALTKSEDRRPEDYIIFAVIEMNLDSTKQMYMLNLKGYYSSNISNLMRAYQRKDLPTLSEFKEVLRKRLSL